MKPAPFRYIPAKTIAQALEVKAQYGDDARFLAGGQSLVPAMNFRLVQPEVLIDLNPLTELSGINQTDSDHLVVGALTRYRKLEQAEVSRDHLPLLAEALPHIAHQQIRNRGTMGGNLSHADPASEMPAVVVALGGRLHARSVRGERWIDAADFFVGPLTTSLASDEMLAAIELPIAASHSGSCFLEVARRRGDLALAGVACMVQIDDDGRCVNARIALCNAADRPVFASQACASLIGRRIGASEAREAAALVRKEIDPGGNIHASKAFQRHIAGVLTARALATAYERAHHG